jgi:hypothetical protein
MSVNVISTVKQRLAQRVQFRLELEQGKLSFPVEVLDLIKEPTQLMESMWKNLWTNYLKNKSTISTTYWYDKFEDPKVFNQFLKNLSDAGWINSIVVPARHWAEIELVEAKLLEVVPQEVITNIRKAIKFNKYKLEYKPNIAAANLTKQNGRVLDTGLTRNGFATTGTNSFKYDTDYLYKYYDAIVMNVTKSMRKVAEIHELVEDGADYNSISKDIVDYHMYSEEEFTLGANYNDSRGRAISNALKKVFNPIGFKDARALLINPATLVPTNSFKEARAYTHAIYLFIAELNGTKFCDSEQDKARIGKEMYKNRELPKLDCQEVLTSFMTDDEVTAEIARADHDRSELHELIWLERLYDELDAFFSRNTDEPFYSYVPIELDASASMLQLTGVLLNHTPYMEATNVLTNTGITDPWHLDNISRLQVKSYATPTLYGSSQTVKTLWDKKGLDYTTKQLALMSFEVKNGFYAVANDFKNMVIDNAQPSQSMDVKIWNEEFTISCNKFKNVGDYTRRYPIYSTADRSVLAIAHTHTHKVPDLKQFKRYFQTLLIHNLDSQIADSIGEALPWALTIHDAFIVSPVHAQQTRELYATKIEDVYADREAILNNYFKSIRLNSNAMKEWQKLSKQINPLTTDFKCDPMALK